MSALAVAALVSACSSSSHTSTPSNSSPSTSAAAPTGAPIVVGSVCDCTGADAVIAGGTKAYQAFVDSVNASGGINGHPLKLIVEDTTTSPSTAITGAQTLIADHVVAVLDDTIFDAGFLPALAQANIPVVGGITSNASMGSNPNVYPIGMTDDALAYAVASTLKTAGATNVGTLYCAEAPQCQAFVGLMKSAGEQVGLPQVYSASTPPQAPNYTAECVAAQQAHVTGVAMFLSTPPEVALSANCAAQGFKPIYAINAEGFSNQLLSAPGLKDLVMVLPEYPYWGKSAGMQAMMDALNKYAPGFVSSSAFNQSTVEGWASALLLQAAVKAGGLTAGATPSSGEVVQGLESLNGETLGGVTVPLTFPSGKPHPIDCWFTGRMQNSVPSLTNGGQTTCKSS